MRWKMPAVLLRSIWRGSSEYETLCAEQNHWSECGRATSVGNSKALGRPHRSVPALENYPMQIAGNRCKVCGRNVTLSRDGKFCAHCETFVHLTCESRTNCDACGQPWVGDWVKDGTLFIRIVPQPYCNHASRDFGEHIRGFMTTKFPDFEWTLNGRSELDWFR